MPLVTMTAAAKACGFKSRSSLQRFRAAGLLAPFDHGRQGLELDGLREHVQGLLRADRRRDGSGSGGDPAATGGRLLEAKARREQAMAQLAELQLAEREGQLVEVAAMRRLLFGHLRRCRDRLQVLPAQLAPVLVGLDPHAAERRMTEALHQVLVELMNDPLPVYDAAPSDLGQPITETNASPDDATARG